MMLTPYTFAVAIAPIPPARAMPEPTLCVKTTARPTTRSNLFIPSLLFDALNWELVSRTYAQGTCQGCFAQCSKRKLRWAWTWPDPGQADPAFGSLRAEKACWIDIELRCRSDSHPFVVIGGREERFSALRGGYQ